MAKKPDRQTEEETVRPGRPEPLGLDFPAGEAPPPLGAVAPGPEAEQAPRGRQTAAPTCPAHKVSLVARHSTAYFTYYYCPAEGCSLAVKQPRPELVRRIGLARQAEVDFDQRAKDGPG